MAVLYIFNRRFLFGPIRRRKINKINVRIENGDLERAFMAEIKFDDLHTDSRAAPKPIEFVTSR
jgi:hypothetical protein